MAISEMEKVMIVSHRTQASELLEALQDKGICQVLNAEEAMVSNTKGDHRYHKIRASIQEIDSRVREMFSQILGLDFNEHFSLSGEDSEQSLSSEELAKMLKP